MLHMRSCVAGLLAAMMLVSSVRAADTARSEVDSLKRDIEELRRKLNSMSTPAARSSVDRALDNKYGPNSTVTTKAGKLTISGLLQVWYYTIENDNRGLFDDPDINGIPDTNEHQDNDSFRIRRSELKFTMDIHENITAVVSIDPAREATSFPGLPSNQGLYKRRSQTAPEFEDANDPPGSTAAVSGVQTGAGGVPRLLKDAYINYHGVIPHHDFQIGQYKPFFGEEGIRSAATLDFVERSLIGQTYSDRDLGATVHGTWWDDRFQYWAGVFNGAGNYWGSAGQSANRSDDNDEKDVVLRTIVRPLWKNETWGSIELGYSFSFGTKGESGGNDPVDAPINGLNRNQASAHRHNIHASYLPGGPVRGWWIRGEWLYIKDRNAPGSVIDLLGASTGDDGFAQTNGGSFDGSGWYISTGYKIADSIWCDSAPGWLRAWEFAFRYEEFENVQVADLVNPENTDNYSTNVMTFGVNYYIKGNNAKIQLNYNIVDNPSDDDANFEFHDVDNNNLVVNFQVAF